VLGFGSLIFSYFCWREIGANLQGFFLGFSFVAVPSGMLVVASTECGKFTVDGYRRARLKIKRTVGQTRRLPKHKALVTFADTYCVQAGVKAAALEFNCAHELPPRFPNFRRVIRRRKGWLGSN
jgi:hypothetical protein